MEKPEKKERKKRIKDQNAERKASRPLIPEPQSPEEFNRQMQAFGMIFFGVMELLSPGAIKELVESEPFPSELDVE